nr:ATP-binding protein [Lysobacter sp.]
MNLIDAPPIHPLLKLFRPSIATCAIERLADGIHSALDVSYRGLGVFGFARFGKTEAINYLMSHLDWLKDRTGALLQVDAPDSRKRTDSTFYQSWLTLLGVRIPPRAQPDELCGLIMGRLIEVAQNTNTRLVVVFIDEAQRLLPLDYENLVSLDNRMTRAGYYFFAVFVHQRDITGYSNEVIANNEYPPHVAGRFLIRKLEFTGLQDVEEVAFALSRYDTGTEWPPGSGIGYTQHFASVAFVNGFRLASYAQALWDAACHLRNGVRLPPNWTWAMKSFEATVVYLLTIIAPRSAQFEAFTDADLKEALEASGLIELELSRYTYQPQGAK